MGDEIPKIYQILVRHIKRHGKLDWLKINWTVKKSSFFNTEVATIGLKSISMVAKLVLKLVF